ncbi:MAG: hypothetical protein ABR991_09860 [Terracidiphilus sp.]
MKAQKIGRALGIGLRVAGRIAGERLAGGAQSPTATQAAGGAPALEQAAGRSAGRAAGGVARGVGGFLRPFRRVGGILWLEITGAFFLLFVLVFARGMWRVRQSYAHGPEHLHFLGYAALAALFLYLGVSSFWRARKR